MRNRLEYSYKCKEHLTCFLTRENVPSDCSFDTNGPEFISAFAVVSFVFGDFDLSGRLSLYMCCVW